jgi:hypothetical protein
VSGQEREKRKDNDDTQSSTPLISSALVMMAMFTRFNCMHVLVRQNLHPRLRETT